MRPYQVYINQEALVSAPRSGPPRKAVTDFIHSLAGDPHCIGDFAERDAVGLRGRSKLSRFMRQG
jgi:hypothetical protein